MLHHREEAGTVITHRAEAFDVSPPLASLRDTGSVAENCDEAERACGTSPRESDDDVAGEPAASPQKAPGVSVEQKSQGNRPPSVLLASFDGLGVGFEGPQGTAAGRNPSDNSLAIGPNHIVQVVNSRLAIFTKKGARFDTTGKVLYGAVATNTIFKGFGGPCEARNNGDAVVRYDQLAERWLYVMPLFQRIPDRPNEPYAMCYALSTGADPLGPYHRYEFRRKLFPDYPRPAIWPDGYYIPTSTGDEVIQKHACVVDRTKMLAGGDATEQCIIIDGVNFLNNADIDGQRLPPAGAANIIMAAGGTQLQKKFEDDGIYVYQMHVDWNNPANTKVSGPVKIEVAPYHYLCDGQLTNCVPQPDTTRKLDAQGDKIMQRLVYRNTGGHESIVALHSVNTEAGGGAIRWYEFRLNEKRDPYLYQQGTYAPDAFYRWMGSIGMDREGNIGVGYSFGGTPNFPGQRFAARLAEDPPGLLTFHETVLVEGEASQTTGNRWEDYATTAMDPSDDCTFWYVGDYLKKGAASYSTRIGAFRLPGCLRAMVSGTSYFDRNHNGQRDPEEPGIAGKQIIYQGGQLTTDANGNFSARLPADPAYSEPTYTISQAGSSSAPRSIHLSAGHDAIGLDFGNVCEVRSTGGAGVGFWSKDKGKALLNAHDSEWRTLINSTLHLVNADGSRFTVSARGYDDLRKWLRKTSARNMSYMLSAQLASIALEVAFGSQDGEATIHDPVVGDWPSINMLIQRVSALIAAHPDRKNMETYKTLIEKLNNNTAMITPSTPAKCPSL